MIRRTLALLAAPLFGLLVGLVAGCDKKEQPTPMQAAPTVPAPAAAASSAAPASAELQDIPTEEDFEEQAAEQVTPQNLESELDRLEKEIGK